MGSVVLVSVTASVHLWIVVGSYGEVLWRYLTGRGQCVWPLCMGMIGSRVLSKEQVHIIKVRWQ